MVRTGSCIELTRCERKLLRRDFVSIPSGIAQAFHMAPFVWPQPSTNTHTSLCLSSHLGHGLTIQVDEWPSVSLSDIDNNGHVQFMAAAWCAAKNTRANQSPSRPNNKNLQVLCIGLRWINLSCSDFHPANSCGVG